MDVCLDGKIDGIDAAIDTRQDREPPFVFVTANCDPTTLSRMLLVTDQPPVFKPVSGRAPARCCHQGLRLEAWRQRSAPGPRAETHRSRF
jgi:hypothetical protein